MMNRNNILKHTFAFTLAEVLLTLAIIGIVAAITIPLVINTTQLIEAKSAWRKAYSELSQANTRILTENISSFKGLTISNNQFRDLFLNYLSYSKKCNQGAISNCWNNGVTSLNGDAFGDNSAAVLNNGITLLFDYDSPTCHSDINTNYNANILNACAAIDVDINGDKGPNKAGKDIFGLYILESTVKPYGSSGDNKENTCNTTGVGCSAQYLRE